MEYIAGIEKAFKDYIASDSINKLREKITDKPMILIAGDQLTGKSTQAKNLAEYYRGTFYSVGNLFREVAAPVPSPKPKLDSPFVPPIIAIPAFPFS